MKSKHLIPQPPKHLRADTAVWFVSVTKDFELESHHFKLSIKACEAHDRGEQAREAIAKFGMTYEDRFGAPRARPECSIERDSRLAFARLVRELGLDAASTPDTRPPTLRGNR